MITTENSENHEKYITGFYLKHFLHNKLVERVRVINGYLPAFLFADMIHNACHHKVFYEQETSFASMENSIYAKQTRIDL